MTIDGHANASLSLVMNEQICGPAGLLSRVHPVTLAVARDPSLLDVPLVEVIKSRTGTVEAYCATVSHPFLNNENSLAAVERPLLWLKPTASVRDVTVWLEMVRAAMVWATAAGLIAAGAGLILSVVYIELARELMNHFSSHVQSIYPFVALALPLFAVAAPSLLSVGTPRPEHPAWTTLKAVVCGALAGWIVNMRSSYAPVVIALVVLACWALWQRNGTRRSLAVCGGALLLGYVVAQLAIVEPRRPSVETINYSYHAVAHPLVLGLALPDNDFARRHGIEWSDLRGLDLARRVDPNAGYLTSGYEPALFRLYVSLWQQYPWDMLKTYLFKAANAFTNLDSLLGDKAGFLWDVAWPLDVLGGLTALWFAVVFSFYFGWSYARTGTRLYVVAAGWTIGYGLLYLESALITSVPVMNYNGYPLLFCGMAGTASLVVAVQAGLRLPRLAKRA
jgi:hypothetical protein